MSFEAIRWVYDHSLATKAARSVLLALAYHAHRDGTSAYPSVSTLIRETAYNRRTVQHALRDLEHAGEITQTGTHSSGTTIYRVNMVVVSTQGGDILAAGGRRETAQTVIRTSKPHVCVDPYRDFNSSRGGGTGEGLRDDAPRKQPINPPRNHEDEIRYWERYWAEQREKEREVPPRQAECLNCRSRFIPTVPNQTTCSHRCTLVFCGIDPPQKS